MAKMNGTWKIIGIIVSVVVVLLGAAVAYGLLSGDVQHNSQSIEEIRPKVQAHERQIAVLETRQTAILEGVQRIEKKIDDLE
jgi:hypothetical protein